jgi:hypothetical protein
MMNDFYVFVFCISNVLLTGLSPIQGVLPAICGIHSIELNSEVEQARGSNPKEEEVEIN